MMKKIIAVAVMLFFAISHNANNSFGDGTSIVSVNVGGNPLVARATPRVSDIEESSDHSFHGRLDKLIAKIPLDKIDFVLSLTFEKSLRKLKLMLMKWDNVVTGHIEKIKKTNGSELSKEDKPNLFEENASADDDSASIKE